MKKLLFLFGVFYCSKGLTQEQFILDLDRVKPFSGINWKANKVEHISSFTTVLENNKILVLSECDHGDESSLAAQCMILKNLIDSEKIDQILVEASWINIDAINEVLSNNGVNGIAMAEKYVRSYGLKYWIDNGFWNYLGNKIIQGKVKLSGFDIDGISSEVIDTLLFETRVIHELKVFQQQQPKIYNSVIFQYLNYDGWGLKSRYDWESYLNQKKFIDIIIAHFRQQSNHYRVDQWQSVLDCFYWMAKRSEVLKNNKYSNQIETEKQRSQFHSIRDSLMAEIFYKKYSANKKGRTVAVMAAYHSLKSPAEVEGLYECCADSNTNFLGKILTAKFNLNLYSIAFISGSGKYGIGYSTSGKYRMKATPIPGSIEYELNKLPYDYCLVDLENQILPIRSFYMNTSFDQFLKANWSNIYSSVFFIKKMQPLILQ